MSNPSAWSRLRWPIKAVIIAIPIVAIGYFASTQGWLDGSKNKDTTTTETVEPGKKHRKMTLNQVMTRAKPSHPTQNLARPEPSPSNLKNRWMAN